MTQPGVTQPKVDQMPNRHSTAAQNSDFITLEKLPFGPFSSFIPPSLLLILPSFFPSPASLFVFCPMWRESQKPCEQLRTELQLILPNSWKIRWDRQLIFQVRLAEPTSRRQSNKLTATQPERLDFLCFQLFRPKWIACFLYYFFFFWKQFYFPFPHWTHNFDL